MFVDDGLSLANTHSPVQLLMSMSTIWVEPASGPADPRRFRRWLSIPRWSNDLPPRTSPSAGEANVALVSEFREDLLDELWRQGVG